MPDPDRIDQATASLDALERRSAYDERNRLSLLAAHGWGGFLVGLLILTGGAPMVWKDIFGPNRDWLLASPALIGGTILLVGLYAGRRVVIEGLGMTIMLGWDLCMVYLIARGVWAGTSQSTYAAAVYSILAVLMSIHIRTLWRYTRHMRGQR